MSRTSLAAGVILLWMLSLLVWFQTYNGTLSKIQRSNTKLYRDSFYKMDGSHLMESESKPNGVRESRDSNLQTGVDNLSPKNASASVLVEKSAPISQKDLTIPQELGQLPTFKLRYIQEVNHSAQMICSVCSDSACKSKCDMFSEMIQYFASKQQLHNDKRPRLNIIPLDPLVWIMDSNIDPSQFDESVERTARSFDHQQPYMTFKGSDHIFLCLTNGCSKLARGFSERLSNKRGTRAILAGIDMDLDSIKWPCPLRVIEISKESVNSPESVLEQVLRQGEQLIQKSNRWICANDTHPVNHWDEIEPGRQLTLHYIEEFNLGLCVFPKGGSTLFKMFMRRLMHRENWNDRWKSQNPAINGLVKVSDTETPKLAKAIFENPNIIKGTIIRNPASRVISGYMDKIVGHRSYWMVYGLKDVVKKQKYKPPTFKQVVNLLIQEKRGPTRHDRHFKTQTSYCGLDTTKYDFVGDLDNLKEDFVEFAESMNIWEDYGASGWGENGTSPMFDLWPNKKTSDHKISTIWKYCDEDLLMKVYNHYKSDFDILGYSIDEILATKPKT
eukprot:g579.t1